MKQRFSSLDVRVISHELSERLVSLRVANVYDLSTRIFLFKLAKPGSKEQLLVDSGFRCHLTDFNRTTAAAPSAFVSRLRKYLKSRRITSVTQIGTDRIIEIVFSDGQYRLYLEFFAAGNIILTDKESTVLALLRVVSEGNEDVDVKLGGTYSTRGKQNVDGIPPVTADRLKDALTKQIAKSTLSKEALGKKIRKKGGDELRRAITGTFPEYPPILLDHAFNVASFDPSLKPEQVLADEGLTSQLLAVIERAHEVFKSLTSGQQAHGYILAKAKESQTQASSEASQETDLLYEDYHPFKPSQTVGKPGVSVLEFGSFNKTVDVFYSSIESQKLESRLSEREVNARRKVDHARSEHEKRVDALREVQEIHERKAGAIEANSHRVEEAIAAVNGLIGQGMDWQDIAKLIEQEQNRQNPVALMVQLPLKLYENTVTLLLNEPSFEDDEEILLDDETDEEIDSDAGTDSDNELPETSNKVQTLAVDIDLGLSPWANARQYYEQKKSAQVKEQKTIQSSEKALKSAEHKIQEDLKKGLKQEKQTLRPARRQMWFEKFLYFISSDGYLVVGGKDAQQNETLYRRYLKKGDIYVHADLPGAASIVVKNMVNAPDAPIPPSTLSQAGSLSVCSSSAWDSKAVMAAWWVNPDQVSKTAPTGEYLKTGGFMIKGKKNFLPPAQLLLGFAVMFQISEESKANHSKHRIQAPSERLDADKELEAREAMEDLQLSEGDGQSDHPASEIGQSSESESDSEHSEGENAQRANPLQIDGQVESPNRNDNENNEASPSPIEEERPDATQHLQEPEGDSQFEDLNETGLIEPTESTGKTMPETSTAPSEKPGKRHLTARERRLLRQGKSIDLPNVSNTNGDGVSPPPQAEEGDLSDVEPTEKIAASVSTAPTGTSTPTPTSRGKRAKNKRAAKKYAEQDEEDRELAMKLLGSAANQQKQQAAAVDKAAREAKIAADRERRRKQHERAAEAERARQERLAAGDVQGLDEEVSPEILEQERKELSNLDTLVGTPAVGDEIIAAIPICAPWNALSRYKYKVKLQPGNLKKGKAVKEIVGRWIEAGKTDPKKKRSIVDETNSDRERIWPREMELIKGWRVEEIFGIVPVGKLRIMMAGGGGGGSGSGKAKGGASARGGKGSKRK